MDNIMCMNYYPSPYFVGGIHRPKSIKKNICLIPREKYKAI